jgi:hypothetical protein
MMLLAWIQGWELYPVAGRSENSGLWILALLLTGVIYFRSRRSGPMLPPADARRALESMEQEGLRDVRWEGHLQACLSWCRTYAVVTLLAAVAVFYTFHRQPPDPDQETPDPGTLSLFGGIALLEAVGIWAGKRALEKGEPAGRWISSAALTAVSLSGAVAVVLRILHWSEEDCFDVHLMIHGAMAVYALVGATLLILPRTARCCTAEYRKRIGAAETIQARSALVVARARSPLSWLPLIVLAMAFALHIYNRNRG